MSTETIEGIVADLREPRTLSQFMGPHDMALALTEERTRIADRLETMLRWMPIETAPKDGQPRMFCDEFGGRFIGVRPHDCPDDAAVTMFGVASYPTHWQPIPPPPNGDKGVRYRLLADGEPILATDEFLAPETCTWHRPRGWEVGMPYPSRVFNPCRRIDAAAQRQEQEGCK